MADKIAKINGHPVAEGTRFVSRVVGNGHRAFMAVIASLFTVTIEGVSATFTALNEAATFVAKKVGALDGTPSTITKADGSVVENERRQGGTTFWAPLDVADNAAMRSSGIWKPNMLDATAGIGWEDSGLKSGYAMAEKKAAYVAKPLPETSAETLKRIARIEKTVQAFDNTLSKLRAHLAAQRVAEGSVLKTENAPAPVEAKAGKGKKGK